MKQRLTIARQLDQLKHKQKKSQNSKDWFKKAAEEADILVSDDSDQEAEQESLEKHNKQVQRLQNQLDSLLKTSLIPKGISTRYLTRNENLAEIATASKGTEC